MKTLWTAQTTDIYYAVKGARTGYPGAVESQGVMVFAKKLIIECPLVSSFDLTRKAHTVDFILRTVEPATVEGEPDDGKQHFDTIRVTLENRSGV